MSLKYCILKCGEKCVCDRERERVRVCGDRDRETGETKKEINSNELRKKEK